MPRDAAYQSRSIIDIIDRVAGHLSNLARKTR